MIETLGLVACVLAAAASFWLLGYFIGGQSDEDVRFLLTLLSEAMDEVAHLEEIIEERESEEYDVGSDGPDPEAA